MFELIRHVFQNDFMPHGHCYFWDKGILIPVVIGDLLTFISYMAIPILIWKFVKSREDLRFSLIFKAFAAFIFFCGIGHLIDVVNIWEPYYRLSAISKMLTGLVSVGTVILLFKLFPKALKIPGLSKLDEMNQELKTKNEELVQLNELYNDTMKAVRLGYWHLNLENNDLFLSPVVYEIHEIEQGTKITLEEGINFYHPDYREAIANVVQKAIETGEPYDLELKLITANDRHIWVRAIGKVEFKNGNPTKLKGLFQDINDQKLRELELLENQSALKEAEEIAKLGSWRWYSGSGKHIWSDQRFKILGYEPGEVKPSLESVLDVIHRADRARVEEAIASAIKEEKGYELTYKVKSRSGEEKVVVDKGLPWSSKKIKDRGYFGIVRDITDQHRKEEELQRSLVSLQRSNRELQSFAYVASHDLQEPLRVITSYLQLIEMSYSDLLDEEGKQYIDSIVNASSRMKDLINDLLTLSRLETSQRDTIAVDLNVVMNTVRENLSMSIAESDAEIVYDKLPTIQGDEGRMVRLFQNLIGNGIKFRKIGEKPRIEIGWSDTGSQYQFKVKDNGIGIKEEYFERIFTIFQRLHTREEYEGTGIGLAICKKIVERHNSIIKVESEFGMGSCFIFELNKGQDERGV